jgi:hypothetical protein
MKDRAAAGLEFTAALQQYLQQHSWSDILTVRLGNLFYPINFFHAWASYANLWNRPFDLAVSLSHLVFYQLLYAVGIPALGLLLFLRRVPLGAFSELLPACFGALLPAALILACPLSTVNHAWAYPIFLCIAALCGGAASRGGTCAALLYGFACAENLVFLVLCAGYGWTGFVLHHAAGSYCAAVCALAACYFLFLLREMWAADEE